MANAPYFVGEAGALAPRRGMFGAGAPQPQGRNILSRIGDFVTAWSAARGNPLGQQVIQQRQAQQQSLLDQQRRDQEYERRQADEQAQWLEREQWQRANPMPRQPTQTDRYLEEYLAPGTDPRRRAALQGILFRPMQVFNPQTQAIEWQYPQVDTGQGAPAGLSDEELDALERGGPTPQASGTFPPGQ